MIVGVHVFFPVIKALGRPCLSFSKSWSGYAKRTLEAIRFLTGLRAANVALYSARETEQGS